MDEVAQPVRTASGARIGPVSSDAATAFLERLGERGLVETWAAFAASPDDGPMIGVAVLGASYFDDGRVMVAVAPAWRRLNVGRDLLDVLALEAGRRKLRKLRVSYPADALVADAFVRACGLESIRQVAAGTRTAVLLLPTGPRPAT
jgi:GNAT superfamily N-acetyltransferase